MKKRFLWLIPAGYFPYHVLLWVRLMRRGVFGVLYENAAPKVLGSFGVVYLTALIGVLVWTIGSAVAKDDPLLRKKRFNTLNKENQMIIRKFEKFLLIEQQKQEKE